MPISTLYQIVDGNLKRTPRYGVGYDAELLPTENYSLVYTKNVGKYGNVDMEAKIISKINGETEFKLIQSDYGKEGDHISLRKKVENYIYNLLNSKQRTLSSYRKKIKNSKSKVKRRCKCK